MESRRAWAEIDLDAFRQNVATVRSVIGPNVGLLAVVKADAYGHGAVAVAREALAAGAAMLGVGDVGEALELRAAGVAGPVLLLGVVLPGEEAAAVQNDLRVTVHSADDLARVIAAAREAGRRVKIHIKVDTGMHRLGLTPVEAIHQAHLAHASSEVELEGLCTHLASVKMIDDVHTRGQLAAFCEVLDTLQRGGVAPPVIHAANSTGTFRSAASHFTMVRSGIALYGAAPLGAGLKPVLALRTRVATLKNVPAGDTVGYDQKFRAPRATRLAILPIGYYDGIPYRLTNCGEVLIRGRRAKVVGSVTMDYTMVDVTDNPDARPGDVATLVGRDGGDQITLEDLARTVGSIPYEIPCRLGRRVTRAYLNASEKLIDKVGKFLSNRAAAF